MGKILIYIICLFFIAGGIDYLFGNRFKIGYKFEEGIKAMGVLAIAVIGIYSLVPIAISVLNHIIVPVSQVLGIDPSIIPASLLATDTGGFMLSKALGKSEELALFSGIIVASSLGATVSYSIPVAIAMIDKKDRQYFCKGAMIGIVSIPVGCLLGGISQGLSYYSLLVNLMPILVFSVLIGIGLFFFPSLVFKGFKVFAAFITALCVIGVILQGINIIIGTEVIPGLSPVEESMWIVGKIAFVLAGAFPMLDVINRVFRKPFERLGEHFGINSVSVGGLLGNMANSILVYSSFKDMNPKGKIICAAFSVSSAFVFGGQLGFVFSFAPGMIGPYFVSKFSGGAVSIIAAALLYDAELKKSRLKGVVGIND